MTGGGQPQPAVDVFTLFGVSGLKSATSKR